MSEGWYDRLLKERDDLQNELHELDANIEKGAIRGEQRDLLIRQSEVMADYIEILTERIDLGPE